MRIFRGELRKIVVMPMVWVFVGLCIALNIGVVISDGYMAEYVNYVSGGGEIEPPPNVFEGYDTDNLTDYYCDTYEISGFWAESLGHKYEKLQQVVGERAVDGSALDLYAGEATHDFNGLFSGTLVTMILAEGALAGALVMLYVLGFEQQYGTSAVVFSTKEGRRLPVKKILAGLTAASIVYLVITGVTLAALGAVFDLGGLLDSSVSSGFNYVRELLMNKPFMTWVAFSAGGYFVAKMVMGLALVWAFALLAAFMGIKIANIYGAFLAFAVVLAVMMTAPFLFSGAGLWGGYFESMCMIMPLWAISSLWLTDLGINTLMPLQDLWCLAGNLAVFAVITAAAAKGFRRKDIYQ